MFRSGRIRLGPIQTHAYQTARASSAVTTDVAEAAVVALAARNAVQAASVRQPAHPTVTERTAAETDAEASAANAVLASNATRAGIARKHVSHSATEKYAETMDVVEAADSVLMAKPAIMVSAKVVHRDVVMSRTKDAAKEPFLSTATAMNW